MILSLIGELPNLVARNTCEEWALKVKSYSRRTCSAVLFLCLLELQKMGDDWTGPSAHTGWQTQIIVRSPVKYSQLSCEILGLH